MRDDVEARRLKPQCIASSRTSLGKRQEDGRKQRESDWHDERTLHKKKAHKHTNADTETRADEAEYGGTVSTTGKGGELMGGEKGF